MCGIAGIIGDITNNDLIHSMAAAQSHRGPDYTRFWKNKSISLAHNRLSIIDLETHSKQPLVSNCGNYILVFNGEIYNYLELKKELNYNFKTNSDTEVLLAAYIEWGKECLHKLNGMFSFAIWDVKKETLFAARDRFGIKPFFYHSSNNKFYFASEIKTLFAANISKIPNEKIWANYFIYGSYGLPSETFWEGVHQLSGGHYLEYDNQKLVVTKWYNFEAEVQKYSNQNFSYLEAKTEYNKLLLDSIALRFRADVKIGFNISGGLDSSALLALVNQNKKGKDIEAYTFYTGDKNYDELPWVEEMISITDNSLHKVLLKGNQKTFSEINTIAKLQDEPYGGIPTVAYSKIFKKARTNNTIVLLDGQGMDEQWAGYDYYLQNNENTIQGISKSPFKKNVLTSEFLKKAKKPNYPKPFKDDLLNKQYRDLFYTKIPRALRFNDRISMGHSTELRVPFLDYRLVEFAFSQPKEYKIRDGVQKFLVRDLVAEHLSDTITYAPKRPLQTPQREWLGDNFYKDVENYIEKLNSGFTKKWFNFKMLKEELYKYKEGDRDSSFHIWQWLNTSIIFDNN